jgi:acyl dehydratase
VEIDIEDLKTRYLNEDFDEHSVTVADAESLAAFAVACGETAPRYTDPSHEDFQAPPTYVSSVSGGGRMMPQGFPSLGMGMDAGKGVYPKNPIRPGATLTARTHLHDIYTKTGRSGRMIFLVARTEFYDGDGEQVAISDSRQVIRERPTE